MTTKPTIDELKAKIHYEPESGLFFYVKNNHRRKAGEIAGCKKNGYVVINIGGHGFLAHRLAVMFVSGSDIDGEIDHIDGDKSNNAISNLRVVKHSTNMENRRRPHKNNPLGLLGVQKIGNRFRASVTVNGNKRHIGMFDTPEIAHKEYLCAKRKFHEGCTI